MRLSGVIKPLKESEQFRTIVKNIKGKNFPINIYGISESAKSYLIYGLYDDINNHTLIVTHSDLEARNLYEDLQLYMSNVYYFPVREVTFYNVDAISGDVRWERINVLKEMLREGNKIIITCVEALAARYVPVELFKKYIFKFSTGDIIDIKEFSKKLIQCGYERVSAVENKGQFSVRGGILDVFPPTSNMPYRIELFDDEIDSIRTFNTSTQRSIDKVFNIEIYPAKEIILPVENLDKGYQSIKNDLECYLSKINSKKNKDIADKIKNIVNSNIESLKNRWSFETIDSYLPYFYENSSTLFEYIKGAFIIVDDMQRCVGKLESVYSEFNDNYENYLSRGNILPKQAELLISKENVVDILKCNASVCIGAFEKSFYLKSDAVVYFTQKTLHNYHGQLDLLIDDIKDKKEKGYSIVILSGTKTRGERLINTLYERGIESTYRDMISEINLGQVIVTYGTQLKGFEYTELKLCIISDKGVFGESKRKSKRHFNQKGIAKIKSFTDLKLGDYVVHVNHGIGVYKGIKQLEVQGHKKDFLKISYFGNDILYVPVEQLDMVQKYIGAEGKTPKINKLSSVEWAKTKRKVKKSIQDIAEDLMKLYAERSVVKGYKFSKDTIWQKQFEEEFPFEETPDQITAIEEIKADMESDKPMDRLICGDVGYGKTEVAIRAAFKAVMDGKQVAFLVPTTILAKQHYNNLIKRFSSFPINIDMISRFKTPAEQKKILKALKEGNVDIIIGTHKLLNKDIKFKDLGLLIIDEEQRFGVTHKEKIKNMKKNIDVIALSATPIPRTLHMSLTGIRNISVIETPPEERYPIQTYVVEFNEQLIRDAIIREINRNGQIYFVYNRVETIKDMAAYISNLVPEARVAIAHGQMTKRELEDVMLDFMEGKYDLLISTTIIETGIDIPNVNTMIIYDADKMGLSQLYQLRGRVGRSNKIAYAYFTYRKDKILTEIAEKRLKAIKEFTELGAGFKIAMRDLEIRGAGNMMGSAQHGHMSTVGYDLYCRMLEETIKTLKGEIVNEPVETTIELKVDAYIPDNYLKDETQKIEIYKKIAAINSYEEMMDIQEEIEDRFSDIPYPVNNLIYIAYIKSIARDLGVLEIKEINNEILIKYDSKERITKKIIDFILDKYNRKIVFKFDDNPVLVYKFKLSEKENLIQDLKKLFESLKNLG
ncbi:transcription-repair-coupling factor [Clostridium tepidiprofundi DSM 19306]|uniref:Transcription-repair-coupling factor n=1 Tax=Clostridium tepidiprofundi DSM 19306 TaxID=1121338 RepID=A0A151B3J7_9CLOT|nr:transcription-repair coupling factor [Clostridium tepidiprofundi]KYH34363.1 transcription-repair-coupling factor [Clostridium tepidiprofundi DSM 19306]